MPRPRTPDPDLHCEYCGKAMTRKTINGRLEDRTVFLKRKYCDRECMAKGQVQETVCLATLRKRAVTFRGMACQACGTTEKLAIHHVDGNPANNDQGNLMTLCDSCHLKWHWAHGKKNSKRQTVCKVCGEPARKLDMCQKHYQRLRKYGDPCLTKKRKGTGFELELKRFC